MNVVDKQLNDAEGKLVPLLLEAKQNGPLFTRVQLWVARMCQGRTLSEYIAANDVSIADRLTVVNALYAILHERSYDRLPPLETTTTTPSNEPPQGRAADQKKPQTKPAEPCRSAPRADGGNEDEPSDPRPVDEATRAVIREEIRHELANIYELIARALREGKS